MFDRCKHRHDTSITDGDQEGVRCTLSFVLKEQVKKVLPLDGGIELKDQVHKLQEHLKSIDPYIKFTIELPGTDELPFLDT